MKNTGLIPTPITKNKTMNEKKQNNGWIEKEFGITFICTIYLLILTLFIMILIIYSI